MIYILVYLTCCAVDCEAVYLFAGGYRTVWRIWFGIGHRDCNAITNIVDMDGFKNSLHSQLANTMEISNERVLYLGVYTGTILFT